MNLFICWTRSGRKFAVQCATSGRAERILSERGETVSSWYVGQHRDALNATLLLDAGIGGIVEL